MSAQVRLHVIRQLIRKGPPKWLEQTMGYGCYFWRTHCVHCGACNFCVHCGVCAVKCVCVWCYVQFLCNVLLCALRCTAVCVWGGDDMTNDTAAAAAGAVDPLATHTYLRVNTGERRGAEPRRGAQRPQPAATTPGIGRMTTEGRAKRRTKNKISKKNDNGAIS